MLLIKIYYFIMNFDKYFILKYNIYIHLLGIEETTYYKKAITNKTFLKKRAFFIF